MQLLLGIPQLISAMVAAAVTFFGAIGSFVTRRIFVNGFAVTASLALLATLVLVISTEVSELIQYFSTAQWGELAFRILPVTTPALVGVSISVDAAMFVYAHGHEYLKIKTR
jgi:hypothetical protein